MFYASIYVNAGVVLFSDKLKKNLILFDTTKLLRHLFYQTDFWFFISWFNPYTKGTDPKQQWFYFVYSIVFL